VLWIFEIKFQRKPVGADILAEVQEKIDRLTLPKRFSYRTVLVHVNGVSEAVEDADYFSKIVDFSDLLIEPDLN